MILLYESQGHWHSVLCTGNLVGIPRHRALRLNPFGARERGVPSGGRSALQRHCHSACFHHNLFLCYTHHDGRLRELVSAPVSARSRYGLPAHEQYELLTAAAGALAPGYIGPGREGGRYGLDRVPAAFYPGPPGGGRGLGDFLPSSRGSEKYLGERQLYHDHHQHAGGGHGPGADAPLRMIRPAHRHPSSPLSPRAGRGYHHVADRPEL